MLTRTGWVVAGLATALIVAAMLFGGAELYLTGGTLLVLLVATVVSMGLIRLRLAVERALHPPRVHAGSPCRVDLRIVNQGTRRTPSLALRDAVAATQGASLLVSPLRSGAEARVAYRIPTERRGIVELGPLEVTLTDPFGLSAFVVRASGTSELTVYPRVDDVLPVRRTTGNDPMAGAEHPNALGRSGEDFYALRKYVIGDDLRRVHWPSTARHDDLMVRQDELPWQGRTTIVLDVRRATTTPEALELAVSAAASIVSAGSRRQDLLRLVTTDGVDSGYAAGHAHIGALMEHLASVQATAGERFAAVVDRLARSSAGGALVAIVADVAPGELEHLARLGDRFGSVTIVRFDRSAWDPAVPVGRAGTARDGIIAVRRGHPFPEAWNAAMRPRQGEGRISRPAAPFPAPSLDDDRWSRRMRVMR
jgi:uncharacterized protein (DUF58 family)